MPRSVRASAQPTATLTGAAARASPIVAAATRSLQLIHSGAPEQVRAAMHPDHPMWQDLGSDQAAAILAIAREMLPQPSTFARSVERVVVYGDEAVVFARDKAVIRRRPGSRLACRELLSRDPGLRRCAAWIGATG